MAFVRITRLSHVGSRTGRLCYAPSITIRWCETSTHPIKMPSIMDAKSGTVDKWHLKEGDSFKSGDCVCEVTLADLTIGVEIPERGILAEILVRSGKTANVNAVIGHFVEDKDAYLTFLDNKRTESSDDEEIKEAQAAIKKKQEKPDTKVMLREIRHLIQEGVIVEGSDFAKKLLSLTRKGDHDLLAAFEGSFEGSNFDLDTFDAKFFIDNAKDVIEEHDEDELKRNSKQ